MTRRELSDAQLDALLGQVPKPPPPSDGFAERIFARAAATPQQSGRRHRVAPRRLRRGPVVWTTIIAANALAFAAAASSWDGQRFDFHRLADLPHRVAAVIHLPHHHAREPERSGAIRLAGRARLPVTAATVRPAEPKNMRQIAIPATASLGMRTPASALHRSGHVGATVAGHPPGWLGGRSAPGKIKTIHKIAQMPAFSRTSVIHSPRMKPARAQAPDAGHEQAHEPSMTLNPSMTRPDFGENRRFGGRPTNAWPQYSPRERANMPPARAERQRRWTRWGRNFRPPQRRQGRRFVRRL